MERPCPPTGVNRTQARPRNARPLRAGPEPATVPRSRRWTLIALAFALLAAGTALDATSGSTEDAGRSGFVDVPPNAYYADAVAWAKEHAITTGVDNPDRFRPRRPVIRAEAVTFLWRAAGQPAAAAARTVDVDPEEYFAPAVDWAMANRITLGVGNGRFEPGRVITRAEAVTLLWRLAGSPNAPPSRFVDTRGYDWANDAIDWAKAEGVTTGVNARHFAPGRRVTRAEAVTMLWRSLGSPAVDVPPSTTVPGETTTTIPGETTTTVPGETTTTATTVVPGPGPGPGPVPSPGGFVHPGVLVGRADLDFVRAKVAAGQQPWKAALDNVLASGGTVGTPARPGTQRFSSLSYQPAPVAVVKAPTAGTSQYLASHPELGSESGAVELPDDARAAYTHALLWYYTGNPAYAAKAMQIMNAWSSTLQEIKFDQPRRVDNNGQVWANGKLVAGWSASLLARAGEIIRYSGAGWPAGDVARFESMLHGVFRPLVITGWTSGANWLMTFSEATIAIGVFTNNRGTFDAGVAMWRDKVPTTIYMPVDGPLPRPPHPGYDTAAEIRDLWYRPSSFVAGLQGETLRDLSHMTMGLGAMSNAAQTAALQGVDLFGAEQARIVAAYERQAGYVNEYLDRVASAGGAQPASSWRPSGWVGAEFNVGGTGYKAGWEVAYSHFTARGVSMPNTARLVPRLRPSGPNLHMSWETLTHAR